MSAVPFVKVKHMTNQVYNEVTFYAGIIRSSFPGICFNHVTTFYAQSTCVCRLICLYLLTMLWITHLTHVSLVTV